MTDAATIARENALSCEAKKHAYRQTQDGVVVSFVLHPQDIPDGLATASLGTRYLLALVEINDQEQPVKQSTPDRTVQRAAIICTEQQFQNFLRTTQPSLWSGVEGDDEAKAAAVLRRLCDVQSRKDLATNQRASAAFESLLSRYEGWRRGL